MAAQEMQMAEKTTSQTAPWWRKALSIALEGLRTGFGLFIRPAPEEEVAVPEGERAETPPARPGASSLDAASLYQLSKGKKHKTNNDRRRNLRLRAATVDSTQVRAEKPQVKPAKKSVVRKKIAPVAKAAKKLRSVRMPVLAPVVAQGKPEPVKPVLAAAPPVPKAQPVPVLPKIPVAKPAFEASRKPLAAAPRTENPQPAAPMQTASRPSAKALPAPRVEATEPVRPELAHIAKVEVAPIFVPVQMPEPVAEPVAPPEPTAVPAPQIVAEPEPVPEALPQVAPEPAPEPVADVEIVEVAVEAATPEVAPEPAAEPEPSEEPIPEPISTEVDTASTISTAPEPVEMIVEEEYETVEPEPLPASETTAESAQPAVEESAQEEQEEIEMTAIFLDAVGLQAASDEAFEPVPDEKPLAEAEPTASPLAPAGETVAAEEPAPAPAAYDPSLETMEEMEVTQNSDPVHESVTPEPVEENATELIPETSGEVAPSDSEDSGDTEDVATPEPDDEQDDVPTDAAPADPVDAVDEAPSDIADEQSESVEPESGPSSEEEPSGTANEAVEQTGDETELVAAQTATEAVTESAEEQEPPAEEAFVQEDEAAPEEGREDAPEPVAEEETAEQMPAEAAVAVPVAAEPVAASAGDDGEDGEPTLDAVEAKPTHPMIRREISADAPFSLLVNQVYEGPLDLLLDLIRKQDIDIYDIPIARITQQFLSYVNQLKSTDVDTAGEFIYMASLLIHIKSKMLLPRAVVGSEDAAEDPRRELVERLLEHERFKNAAQMLLEKQMIEAATWTNPGVREFRDASAAEPEIAADTTDLVRIFREILDRARNRPVIDVEEDSVTVGQMMQYLSRRLTMEDKPVSLRRLLSHTKSERALIAMFLALLELVRMQAILLRQDLAFSEIFIKKHSGFEAAMNQTATSLEDEWR